MAINTEQYNVDKYIYDHLTAASPDRKKTHWQLVHELANMPGAKVEMEYSEGGSMKTKDVAYDRLEIIKTNTVLNKAWLQPNEVEEMLNEVKNSEDMRQKSYREVTNYFKDKYGKSNGRYIDYHLHSNGFGPKAFRGTGVGGGRGRRSSWTEPELALIERKLQENPNTTTLDIHFALLSQVVNGVEGFSKRSETQVRAKMGELKTKLGLS